MTELQELRRLAEEAAAENDVESDWFDPALIESDEPVLSSPKARRFIAAMTPQMAMRLILLADRAPGVAPTDPVPSLESSVKLPLHQAVQWNGAVQCAEREPHKPVVLDGRTVLAVHAKLAAGVLGTHEAQPLTVNFEFESLTPLEGMDRIYVEYAKTFGRYPDAFMAQVVGQTKEDLFIWWGAHREKIRAALAAPGVKGTR